MVPNPDATTTHPSSIWLEDGTALEQWRGPADALIAVDTDFVRERTYWPALALRPLAGPAPARLSVCYPTADLTRSRHDRHPGRG